MKHHYPHFARPLLSALALLLGLPAAQAQQAPALLRDEPASASPLAAALTHARPLSLDVAQARAVLADAPAENQPGARPLELSLPLPDGGTGRFQVWRTAVMAPALAAQYPDIRTYAGRGLDDATATVRLDLTPQGFHAQILSAQSGTIYIEPARRDNQQHHLSFFGRDVRPGAAPALLCDVPAPKAARAMPGGPAAPGPGSPAAISGGGLLRTYRLAVAATGEYTFFHGGTVPLAMAAIVTSINRVNGVFETELAVRLVLVANNAQLIYTNAGTDPYTDGNTLTMLAENQAIIDNLIGPANYDVGHVFGGQNAGGHGAIRSVCVPDYKARGATALASPFGDFFDVKYVCHELGHQFGGNHSFNSSAPINCGPNRSANTAWEPGSGTTIMSYSGACGDDIQYDSDPNYHLGNLEEMRAFIVAATCAVPTATTNTPPGVSGPAGGKVLPVNTPFKLTATAIDADGDPLTYSWEQVDRGTAAFSYAPQVANDNVPLFRTWPPTTAPTRYFPRLNELVQNSAPGGERLPTVARQLTFQVAVRDLHQGPAGLIGGLTTSDSVKLQVSSTAGPFVVTSPNTALSWAGGSQQTVTWNVAGTTANGVNCQTVNVRLSTDGGLTYPTVLAAGVPNSGSASVTMPGANTAQARIMVEAADNYFFDISNQNFSISSPSGPCAPPSALTVGSITDNGATLSFATAGGAAQYVVTTSPATTTQTVAAGPVTLTGLAPRTSYTVSVVSSCGGSASVAAATRFITTGPPPCDAPNELAVTNRTTTTATLSFLGPPTATSYTITTVPATTTQTVTAGPVTLTGLTPATRYEVRVVSNCAGGATSPVGRVFFRARPLPPVNDLCANALPLTCGQRLEGYTEGSTATGDPTGSCGVETVDQGGVFYSIVGTGGLLTLSTCDLTTDYDSKLFVYRGSCGSYTCVTSNDDACGTPSTVSFMSASGVTYYVFVSGWGADVGFFGLKATCGPVSAKTPTATAFLVQPNPSSSGQSFRVTLPAPASSATATLRDALGRRVGGQTFRGTATELPTTGLAPGVYLLTVQVAGHAPAVRRVVVE